MSADAVEVLAATTRPTRARSTALLARQAPALGATIPTVIGQDPRTAPDIAPLWSLLDLTPDGRDSNWYPKLSY